MLVDLLIVFFSGVRMIKYYILDRWFEADRIEKPFWGKHPRVQMIAALSVYPTTYTILPECIVGFDRGFAFWASEHKPLRFLLAYGLRPTNHIPQPEPAIVGRTHNNQRGPTF